MNYKLIKILLVIMGAYLMIDAVIHLTPLRLNDVKGVWPTNALIYSNFISQIYGSFALLFSLIAFGISREVERHRNIIFIIAAWSLFHGVLIFYFLGSGVFDNFGPHPSLYVYIKPIYKVVTLLEGIYLIFFALVVAFSRIKNNK